MRIEGKSPLPSWMETFYSDLIIADFSSHEHMRMQELRNGAIANEESNGSNVSKNTMLIAGVAFAFAGVFLSKLNRIK